MTQIVRKFILFSILLTLLASIAYSLTNNKNKIIESFGIRDLNGRRNKALRRCLGSLSTGVINQSKECDLENFQNTPQSYNNRVINSINVMDIPIENTLKNIIQQIPDWIKNNSSIDTLFDSSKIELQYKDLNLDTKHIKFKTALPLDKYEIRLRKALEKDLSKLSRNYKNMNPEEQKNTKNILLKQSFIAFKINIKDGNVLILPKDTFKRESLTFPIDNNDNLLVHINSNSHNPKSKNYKLKSITIEKTDSDINIKFADITIDIGLYNLGNNNDFVVFKSINVI